MKPISAFSVYAAEGRPTEPLLNGKKNKRKLQRASNQKNKKRKHVKQMESADVDQQRQTHEGALNIFVKTKAALLKRSFIT